MTSYADFMIAIVPQVSDDAHWPLIYAYILAFICTYRNCFLLGNVYPEKRHYGTFSPTESGKIPNQTPINVSSADSLSSCALQCLKDVLLCVSVAYNRATGTCSFYPNFFFVNMTSSPNTNVYVLQPY